MQNSWTQIRIFSALAILFIGLSSHAYKGGDSSGGEGGLAVEIIEIKVRDIFVKCLISEKLLVCTDCALISDPIALQSKLNAIKCE